MSSTTVYGELKTYLQGLYSGTYPVVDFDTIDPSLETADSPFIAIEEITSSERMAAIGDLAAICLRETGAFVVHCFTPAPESSASARLIADNVKENLRYRNINGVRIIDVSPPDLEIMNNGLWTSGGVSVYYEYDTHSPHPGGA